MSDFSFICWGAQKLQGLTRFNKIWTCHEDGHVKKPDMPSAEFEDTSI